MKWTIFIALCIISVNITKAQKQLFMATNENDCPVNIASSEIKRSFTPSPFVHNELKSAAENKSSIVVTFVDFPEDAKAAFLYATSIWESILTSSVPINIMATWELMPDNVIAKSRPTLNFRTFEGSQVDDVYYPVALVEKLSGKEMNRGESDIICSFNENMPWYFGTNGNTPVTKYDFVTAVLHEITHGLGFYGFFKDNNESGYINNANNLPSIYDYFIFNEINQQISNKTIFNSPSVELHHQLTSSKLKLYEPANFSQNQKIIEMIYAPENWEEGASIYHFNQSQTDSKLMSASLRKGEAIHHPGETTLNVLSEIGWKSITFNFNELKDNEQKLKTYPIEIGIETDIPVDSSSFKLCFSTDNFNTTQYIILHFNEETEKFSGEMPLNNYQGVVQYYFQIYTEESKAVRFPSTAPEKKFSVRFGADYYPPVISHNPTKIISSLSSDFQISAIAKDNVGISKVKVEYKINGIMKESVVLSNDSADHFLGQLQIEEALKSTDRFEYRLVAEDKSALMNKANEPAIGFYNVKIFDSLEPVHSYYNDFNSYVSDFVASDFAISRPVGFSNGNLHTENPYHSSNIENEYYNHIAQLKYPIIIQKDGFLKFDEIVLVEPGEIGSSYNGHYFWDYVIVEGSKDNGKSWLPVSEGYDAQIDDSWNLKFENSIINNTSTASGQGAMFVQHTFNLTENANFVEGDIVLFRFRMAADNSVNGWGWAIDNLQIQKSVTPVIDIITNKNTSVYPNPFTNILNIESQNSEALQTMNIKITDISGKTVYAEDCNELGFNNQKQIDLTHLKQGMYILNIIEDNSRITTKKLIKN